MSDTHTHYIVPFGTWFLVVDVVELSELDWGLVLQIHRNRTAYLMIITPFLVTYLAAFLLCRTSDAADIAQNL